MGSYINFWILFGASNQLLAALTLLSITVWLSNAHKRFAFTLLPTIFILIMTLWALGTLTLANFQSTQGLDMPFFNALASSALILLAAYLTITALSKLRRPRGGVMGRAFETAAE